MITDYENDKLVIPEKYLKMTASELEQEKARLLEKAKAQTAAQPVRKKQPAKNVAIYFRVSLNSWT